MLGFILLFGFMLSYGYAYISIINGQITMRMPDGQRVHYDKETHARGYYVSVGFFLDWPVFILILYIIME